MERSASALLERHESCLLTYMCGKASVLYCDLKLQRRNECSVDGTRERGKRGLKVKLKMRSLLFPHPTTRRSLRQRNRLTEWSKCILLSYPHEKTCVEHVRGNPREPNIAICPMLPPSTKHLSETESFIPSTHVTSETESLAASRLCATGRYSTKRGGGGANEAPFHPVQTRHLNKLNFLC